MMEARRNRGFTLVELILVIAILGVVTTMGVVTLGLINEKWKQVQTRTELDAVAEYALGQVRQDMAAFVSPSLTGAPLQGMNSETADAAYPGTQLATDRLVIPTRGATPEGGEVLAAVKYAVENPEGARVLTRTRTGLYGDPTQAQPVNVAEGMVHFNVQFKDPEGQWQDAWDSVSPPLAVRVSLVVADTDRPERQVARVAEFAVRVN